MWRQAHQPDGLEAKFSANCRNFRFCPEIFERRAQVPRLTGATGPRTVSRGDTYLRRSFFQGRLHATTPKENMFEGPVTGNGEVTDGTRITPGQLALALTPYAQVTVTVPPNGIAKLRFGGTGLPNQTAGTVDVYGRQILDATLEAGNTTEVKADTTASALLLKHEFLDGGADDVTLATLGEVLLEPTLITLGIFFARSNSQSSVASASFGATP